MTHSFPTRRSSDLGAAGKVRLDAGVIDDIAVLHAQHGGILDPADVDLARPRHDRRRVVHLEGAAVVAPAGPDHAGIAAVALQRRPRAHRSEEHTSELQSLMRSSYAVFCLKKKT